MGIIHHIAIDVIFDRIATSHFLSYMQKNYDPKEAEARIYKMWEEGGYFTPTIDPAKKPFSMFLAPPNASGGMHIGNALMIAIQDILARYARAKGRPTLWIPGTDHGGYETQVTFERELEKKGEDRSQYSKKEIFKKIEKYVEENNKLIKSQIRSMGASVDWTRFRYTMDEKSLHSVGETFKKMVSDGLIYRRSYMLNYCPICSTVLAGIELKEKEEKTPLYFIKFPVQDSGNGEYIALATTKPEFIFTTTHVLVNPADHTNAHLIGKKLINPISGDVVEIIADKRKYDPEQQKPFLSPFSPSYKSYDYEYTLRNPLPSRNVLDWNGNMLERHTGMKPVDARAKEVAFLEEKGYIEKVDTEYIDTISLCKRGHTVQNIITLTWFLRLNDEKKSLKKAVFESARTQGITIVPQWREKGLIEWMDKMHDWPIARQNIWGIRMPIWYEVSDPSLFTVWFLDKAGTMQHGDLKHFLDAGIGLDEIKEGLDRLYADELAPWTLTPEADKTYLPETDTFDTWFSSGQWGTIVFGDMDSPDFSYFYPSNILITGHDLIRLFVSRCFLLSQYITDKLPFKTVYLHRLIKGPDGQKMSKSLGNAVTLEQYLEEYGADITRMTLVSYTEVQDDFVLGKNRFLFFKDFSEKLWGMGELVFVAHQFSAVFSPDLHTSYRDKQLITDIDKLSATIGSHIEKYQFSIAQDILCDFIKNLNLFASEMNQQSNPYTSLAVFQHVYAKYITLLHPFMPFMTEELYQTLYQSEYKSDKPLAAANWPV